MAQASYERYIRASELARWAYCQRAWWLQYARGHPPTNIEALKQGRRFHGRHARIVARSELYRRLAILLTLLALVLVALVLTLLLVR